MRAIISIMTANARAIFAVGALLLAFTAYLHASVLHDPFGADSVALRDASNGVAAIWRDELARIATDQEAVKACLRASPPDCGAVLKLIEIVEEARGYHGRALLGHIKWLILDNGTMTLVTDVDASAVYLPLFVLDDTGTRRYVLPAL